MFKISKIYLWNFEIQNEMFFFGKISLSAQKIETICTSLNLKKIKNISSSLKKIVNCCLWFLKLQKQCGRCYY